MSASTAWVFAVAIHVSLFPAVSTVLAAAVPDLQPPPVPLPPKAQAARAALYRAAMAGQYDVLGRYAKANPTFTFHFGFVQQAPAAYWRAEARRGEDPLPKLAAILRLPPAFDGGVYTFPAAAGAKAGPADWEALKAVYPVARVARFRTEGYTGWRAGIDAAGRWRFFVHGD